jgi:hypothetical protein
MPQAKPRSIRFDENVDVAIERESQGRKMAFSALVNEYCSERVIAKEPTIYERLENLEARLEKLES